MTREAEYQSKCAICGEWIEEGDPIEFDEDAEEWVHDSCYRDEVESG